MARRTWMRLSWRWRMAGTVLRGQRDADVCLCVVWAVLAGALFGWSASWYGPFAAVAVGVLVAWLLVAWTVVTDRHSGEVLGVLGCYPKPARPHACLLGWWMGPNGRDQGYELEVVGAAVGALHSVGAIANVYFVGRGTYPDTLQVLHDIGAVETTGPPVPVADGSRASLWFVHAAPAAPPVR